MMAYVGAINKLNPLVCLSKAPSVTVTWGWGSRGLMVDLGNNAIYTLNNSSFL
uniref:Uncharacterized protein n=1 Tax=Klebsiella pneumoniae TaxID=573 RepID=A0A2P1BPX0_KLEPN|nr:hypothetical protein [Klebsiella pneumoniae]